MRWMHRPYVKKALSFLKKANLTISGTWVDCGCGSGNYAHALVHLGADPVIALDINISNLYRIPFPIMVVAGDCGRLPVKDGSGSGVLYVNVLHYYKQPHFLIQEAYNVLKRNGYILVIEYSQSFSTAWDPYPLTAAEMEALLKDFHFGVVKSTLLDVQYRPKYLIVGKK